MPTPEELYQRGLSLSSEGKREEAYRCYLEAAERGHAKAQNMVGRCLDEGWACDKDPTAAVAWYRRAAEQGDAQAQCNLAVCLHDGSGVPKDRNEACLWFVRSAEQGNAYAQNKVGRYLDEGWVGDENPAAAAHWYRKAAEQGYATAQCNLAGCLHDGRGVPKDPAEALLWYTRAADQGNAWAQNMVGRYLDEGWAGQQDPTAAAAWYRKAAEQGHGQAQCNYAVCLHDGFGVARDRAEAYRWFVRSAEQGYHYAQYMLGRYLEEGWAGPKDLDAAATWYERASRQGNSHAKAALERIQPLLKAQPATPAPAPSQTEAPAAPGTSAPVANQADEVNRLLAELDELTGLKGVKREIRKRVASVRLSRLRGDTGGRGSLHMVFSGSPGTGKTTVARLVGQIYQALGLITDGERFVECGREDLVGSHIGETALRVKEQVDRALGGILFIDEAYSLYVPDSDRDFGSEAIDTLVKAMEDHRDNLVVIMAGYTDEMRTMIRDANPGLASRFRTWVEFENYTPDELVSIFEGMAAARRLQLDDGCRAKAAEVIAARNAMGNFGNARGVRNLLDDTVERMVLRLSEEGDAAKRRGQRLSREEFSTIREVDIPPVPKGPTKPRKYRMGFS